MASRVNRGLPSKVDAAVARGVALAKQIRYSHDGHQETANMVAAIPKSWEVLPRNAIQTQPLNGDQPYVEFELPEQCGKISDQVLQMDVRFATPDAGVGSVQVLPTTFWFKSVAILYNGQEIERVEAEDVHNETVNYVTDQTFNTIRSLVNVSATGGLTTAFATTGTSAWTTMRRFYLPLWANFANTAQLFPVGFKGTWKYRLQFAPNVITASTGTTGGSALIEVTNPKLYIVEHQLDEGIFNTLRESHQSGIVYRSILRNKFTKNEPTIPTTVDYNAILTSFTTDSAGLVVYVKPDSAAPVDQITRYPFDFVALRNKNNAELTINLPAALLEGFIMPTQIPLASVLTAGLATANNHYLLCFCSNLLSVLETGAMLGGLKLDGGIRVVFRPISTLSSVVVNVLSFDYAKMEVRGGVPKIERKA